MWSRTTDGFDGRWRIRPDTARQCLAAKIVGATPSTYNTTNQFCWAARALRGYQRAS